MMMSRGKAAFGGALVGLGLLAVTAIPSFAQPEPPVPAGEAQPPSHEQMDTMMTAAHGEEGLRQMHETMGGGDAQRGEQLMEQCVSMMALMQEMGGMMGQGGQSMQDMMRGMSGTAGR